MDNFVSYNSINNSELFLGWTLHYEEVSNNVYQFKLTDNSGRQAGCKDHDFERGIETCVSYAFDIEKQLNRNWNKFLFDIFKFKLSKHKLTEEIYHENVFGSWTIQLENGRIILDGRDYLLTLQCLDKNQNWIDRENIRLSDLTYDKVKIFTNSLEEQTILDEEVHTATSNLPKASRTWWKKLIGS